MIAIPISFNALGRERKMSLMRWMNLPESALFRQQLETMALKKMVEAADALGQDDDEKAKLLSKEGRELDQLLELFNAIGQGYFGDDEEKTIELLEARAVV